MAGEIASLPKGRAKLGLRGPECDCADLCAIRRLQRAAKMPARKLLQHGEAHRGQAEARRRVALAERAGMFELLREFERCRAGRKRAVDRERRRSRRRPV